MRPMSPYERDAFRQILDTAAAYIESGWGEPLKDCDFDARLSRLRIASLAEEAAREIRKLNAVRDNRRDG